MNDRVLGVALYRFRATFRRRWGGYLSIVLLVGLVGGLAMGSIAAARRTQSSFPTYLASTNPSDLNLPTAGWQPGSPNSAGVDPSIPRMLARLPHVRRVENEYNINAQPLGKNGLPTHAPPKARSLGISVLNNDGSIDGEFSDQDRLTAIDGRLANPGRANEIMVSSIVAQSLGLHVGDVVPIGFYTNVQTTLPGYGTGSARFTAKPPLRMDMKLIGIVAFNNQVVLDSLDQTGTAQIVYTPTLTRRLAQCCVTSTTSFLQLDHGTGDVSTVEREIEKVAGPSGPVLFGVKSNTGVAEQAIKPESIAIGVFGAIAALAALLIGGQTISRQLRSGADAVGIGTVVGIPLGIVLGRFLWDLFAHDIDSVPVPTVPGWPILLIAVGAFVLANIVATLPGRMAANTPTALLLRAE